MYLSELLANSKNKREMKKDREGEGDREADSEPSAGDLIVISLLIYDDFPPGLQIAQDRSSKFNINF